MVHLSNSNKTVDRWSNRIWQNFTHSWVAFQLRERNRMNEWHLLFWTGCLGRNCVSCSHKTLIVLAHCRSCSWYITLLAHRGFVVCGTSVFSIFLSALVGGTDPSLPWHLFQRQATNLKCHFNFLQALVTAGLALSRRLALQVSYSVVSERLFSLHLPFKSYSHISFNVLFLWLGGS